jgi:SRSO17 transposase
MKPTQIKRLECELGEYLDSLISGMGRPERRRAMSWYVTGLLLDGERKSIEPIAARLVDDASEIEAMRQRLQQCVTLSTWSDREVLGRLARKLDRELPGAETLIVDDTGHPKKGKHSVGVARQYSGTLGRVDNCQVAVSLHVGGESVSGCIAYDLYLSEEWTADLPRRRSVGIPNEVGFRTKWQMALEQIDWALAAGVRKHTVLADAGFGDATEFREALMARGLSYIVGINGQPVVWPPESAPSIPRRKPGKGHPPTRYRDDAHPPETIAHLAGRLRYRRVSWREGSRGWQSSRFAAVRIRTAHRHIHAAPPGEEQWLLCESPKAENEPRKYWLATLPPTTTIRTLVRLAKLRWRVERDYQEMKQELGLDHFEGRTWRGFHHHAALCAVAHGFLALQRALFPPEEIEVDPSDGPALPAAGAASENRLLSALSSTG